MTMAEEFKSSPQRDSRISRARSLPHYHHHKAAARSSFFEALAQVHNGGHGRIVAQSDSEDGKVRMKIMLRKQDLMQMLQAMKDSDPTPPSLSLEQRLLLMRRRLSAGKASQGKCGSRSSWRPVLQSIPEEL
ncbi:hypothetical protein Ancab_017302 [Ancistrocladus abbreviatus]